MKQIVGITLGVTCWIVVLGTFAVNSYDTHQKAIASSKPVSMTQSVSNTQKAINSLQTQLASATSELNSTKQNASSLSADKTSLCNFAVNIEAQLTKYKINLNIPLPVQCQ